MTTIGESDLSATFDRNFFEGLQCLLEYIHHSHFISEANNYMESRRMES